MATTQDGASPPAPTAAPGPATPSPAADEQGGARRTRHPRRIAAVIALVGILLTLVSALAAARTDRNTEQRLLEGQTRQVAAVLSTLINVIEQPLEAALGVVDAAGPADPAAGTAPGTAAFERFMATRVGPGRTFVNASLWMLRSGHLARIDAIGATPFLPPDAPDTQAHLRRAFDSPTTTVRLLSVGGRTRVAYARAEPASGRVVYAERAIPANRRSPIDQDEAFSELHYAIYLGHQVRMASLTTTDTDPARLPFEGRTARATVPFGDSVLTVTATPRHHLGADLGQQLPWLLLGGGLLMTAAATRTGRQLAEGRQAAEEDAATITGLYASTEALYSQQRDLFVSLQRALLPHVNPAMPNIELASEYVAGARGLDIGGDWFSIIDLPGGTRFGFVVGDVSGRGVDAVAVMAHVRFTIRAYLMEIDDPAAVLEKCAPQFDIVTDGHLTTALVGVGDWRTGVVTLASAGHPPPVLLTADGATFVDLAPGRPLGTGGGPYPTTSVTMPPGSTLFCFTDGLVERRGEDIDAGLDRLARVLAPVAGAPVAEVVAHALGRLRREDTADDIATLAIRWTGER